MSKPTFRPELIHGDFTLCKHPSCPRASACLRRLAYDNAPPFERAWFVDERRDASDCAWYRSAEVVRFARGFRGIMPEFKAKDKRALYADLQGIFGYGMPTVYRYINGVYALAPHIRGQVEEACRRYGVDPRFDAWEEDYDVM